MDLDFLLHAQRTPNPNSVKWVLTRPLVEAGRTAHFQSAPAPGVSPLADRLFAVPGVVGVFLAANFVTVTKRDECEWSDLAEPLVDALRRFAESGAPALAAGFEATAPEAEGGVAGRIRRVLDDEIRPAVARDGGDVIFAGYRDGVVELYLQGSCSGCPSALATLKFGIEARLREVIPEVMEVVAL